VKEIIFVCCPLVALMQDQVEKMLKIPEVKSTYAGIVFCIILEKGGLGEVSVGTPWLIISQY
jgi:hypothetical protein